MKNGLAVLSIYSDNDIETYRDVLCYVEQLYRWGLSLSGKGMARRLCILLLN
ncbi:MAG: hypothetical protein Q4D60_05110 [Eubacteriales bacterium]|nr:hypothetical protein [Eubacteriales bacterium]